MTLSGLLEMFCWGYRFLRLLMHKSTRLHKKVASLDGVSTGNQAKIVVSVLLTIKWIDIGFSSSNVADNTFQSIELSYKTDSSCEKQIDLQRIWTKSNGHFGAAFHEWTLRLFFKQSINEVGYIGHCLICGIVLHNLRIIVCCAFKLI